MRLHCLSEWLPISVGRGSLSSLDRCICVQLVAWTLQLYCERLKTSRLPQSWIGAYWWLRMIWSFCVLLLHWMSIALLMKWQSGVNLHRCLVWLHPMPGICPWTTGLDSHHRALFHPHAIVQLVPWLPVHQLFVLLSKWCCWAVHVIAGIRRSCGKPSHEVLLR